jgi:lipopolysaccharide/colanic/teichoic acid biosynthesis glycosyltransferase
MKRSNRLPIRTLVRLIVGRWRHADTVAEHVVRSRISLQSTLEKERARADRSGNPLYWVILRLTAADATPDALLRLADLVAARVRETDEVGCYDDTSVCAILPETDRAGADDLAADLPRLAVKEQLSPMVTIASYHPGEPAFRESATEGREVRSSRTPATTGNRRSVRSSSSVANDEESQESSGRDRFLVTMPRGKRIFDIVGATITLVLASPIMVAAAIAVRLSSPGPILFVQRRSGHGGRAFAMYKFRTMHVDAEAMKASLRHLSEQDGPAFKMRNDPRVSRLGRLLRQSSIDELPQLFNVLKGDMSLVGPRPPTLDEVQKYRHWYLRRLDVTPGITCIWQVSGRAQVTFESWMRMDIRYIQGYSVWQDVALLTATVPAILFRRGAH